MVEDISEKKELKWYFKGWVIAVAILCFGPLGLLPLWFRPRTSKWVKIWVSVVVIGFTVLMIQQSFEFYKRIMVHYEELSNIMQEI